MDGVHLISWDLIAAPFDSPPVPTIYWSEDLLATVSITGRSNFFSRNKVNVETAMRCGDYNVNIVMLKLT